MLKSKRAGFFFILGCLLGLLFFSLRLGIGATARLKSTDGRVNTLLLGIPGGDYPGATLSDSLILVSINPQKRDLALISIPRDIWIPSLSGKINSAYASGEAKKEGGGLTLAKAIVGQILGLPVHYGIVADFKGFEEAIDLVGGLNIFVENSFDDFRYPISGKEEEECGGDPEYNCRYEHLRFEKGWEQMTGERALKFARSRYATNSGEGTDFARSLRQRKIIFAFAQKASSFKVLARPKPILGFLKIFRKSLKADITLPEALSFLRLVRTVDWGQARSFALDYGEHNEGGVLINPRSYDFGAWVLLPRDGDWDYIQEKVRKFLEIQREF